MPNITEFNAGELSIRPTETGVESFAQAGRRIGAFYNQQGEELSRVGSQLGRGVANVGEVAANYMAHQEISGGAASGTQLFADQLQKKDDAIKAVDPNDPHYGQKIETAVKQWREEQLEPALDTFAGQFHTEKGQEWSQRFVDNTRQTMFVHSTADIQTAAGIGIHNSARTIVNTATATVLKDPSMLASQFDLVDHGITGLVQSNPVKGIEASKIQSETMETAKAQLVKSAVQGAIMNGGNYEKIINDPRYSPYVNGAEVEQFAKAQRVQDRANLAYTKQAEAYQKSIDNSNVEAARNQIWSKYVTADPATGQPKIDPQFFKDALQIPMKYPNAPNATETARTLLDWGEHQQKPEKPTNDPATVTALSGSIFNPDKPTTVLDTMRAEADGKITHTQGSQFRDLIKLRDEMPNDSMFKFAIDGIKPLIEGTSAGDKADTVGKFPAFMQSFLTEYLKERNAGTLPPNALDLSDDNSLINKMSKPFSLENTLGQFIKNNGGVGAPAPAPKPKQETFVIPGQT